MFEDKREKQFLQAHKKYADDIYRHCYFRVYNKELAEDLTQETFIKTWKYIIVGQEIKNIKAFLYKVALNLVIDHSRKKKEIFSDNIEDIKETGHSVRLSNMEADILNKLEVGEIVKLLDLLSESQRQVVAMRYIDELSPVEIAEILGESASAVSVRINQGMARLRKIIKEKRNV